MIIGLGSDLVNVERIQRSLNGLGKRWVNKILVPAELERARAWDDAIYVAKLFAAKEACSKALGTGMAEGVHWHDIEIVLPNKVMFSNAALRRLKSISGEDQQSDTILDVFYRNGMASGTVIIFGPLVSR